MKDQIKKQAIGEMSMDLKKAEHWYLDTDTCDYELDRVKTVKNLYGFDAGYRKQIVGEWVDQYRGGCANPIYRCSVCGETACRNEKIYFLTSYCPNCGARMKGGAE